MKIGLPAVWKYEYALAKNRVWVYFLLIYRGFNGELKVPHFRRWLSGSVQLQCSLHAPSPSAKTQTLVHSGTEDTLLKVRRHQVTGFYERFAPSNTPIK